MKGKKKEMAKSSSVTIGVLAEKMDNIKETVNDIKDKLEKDYVTNDRFEPVRNIVYGLIALITIAVVGGLLSLIIVHK